MAARCGFAVGWPYVDVKCARAVPDADARANGRYGGWLPDGAARCWEHLFFTEFATLVPPAGTAPEAAGPEEGDDGA